MEAETYSCTCTEVTRPAPPSVYCDIPVGKDTTGNFSLSYKGVAVKTDCNRFVAFRGNGDEVELYDVTGLTLPGCDPLIYRVPVTEDNVHPGDLLLISDCPPQALYVTKTFPELSEKEKNRAKKSVTVEGITPSGQKVTYLSPRRLGDCARYIRIVSVLDACGIKSSDLNEDAIALIAALLCCKPCGNNFTAGILSDTVAANLLNVTLPGGKKGIGQLPLLLALQQSQCLESFILTRALQGRIDEPCPEIPQPGSSTEAKAKRDG